MQSTDARRARLEELRKECLDLEATKSALRTHIQKLDEEIEDAEDAIREKKREMSPLAPVYTLPEDVVIEILETAYQHHFPHCRLDDGMPHTHSPLVISHVSRWWRSHALSIPKIWTCIHVTPGQPAGYDAVIRAYLIRSRDLPISIFFLCDDYQSRKLWWPWEVFQKTIWVRYKKCWRYLLAEKHRWKNCAIYAGHVESVKLLLKNIEDERFPQLEFFGFSRYDEISPPKDQLPKFEAPKLTHLRTNCLFDITKSPVKLFSNLTELKILGAGVDVGTFMKMLSHAASTLQTMTIVSTSFYLEDQTTLTSGLTVTLPRITHLILANIMTEDDGLPNMCAALCRAATSLLDLSIDYFPNDLDDLASGGLILPTLRRFMSEKVPPTTRESILALPRLETLQAPGDMTKTLTTAVEIDTGAGIGCMAWPELKTLVLSLVDQTELVKFVEHRARVQHHLRTLVVTNDILGQLSTQTMELFSKLKLRVCDFGESPVPVDEDWKGLSRLGGWDEDLDKPVFVPWERSFAFHDQFENPAKCYPTLSTSEIDSEEHEEDEDSQGNNSGAEQ